MNTPIEEARKLINKEVTITNERGAKYAGILSGVRNKDKKFCLTRLLIINKHGGITAIDVLPRFKRVGFLEA